MFSPTTKSVSYCIENRYILYNWIIPWTTQTILQFWKTTIILTVLSLYVDLPYPKFEYEINEGISYQELLRRRQKIWWHANWLKHDIALWLIIAIWCKILFVTKLTSCPIKSNHCMTQNLHEDKMIKTTINEFYD